MANTAQKIEQNILAAYKYINDAKLLISRLENEDPTDESSQVSELSIDDAKCRIQYFLDCCKKELKFKKLDKT